jgi:hypothetical protein
MENKTSLKPPTSWDTDWLGAKPAINKPPAPPVPTKGPESDQHVLCTALGEDLDHLDLLVELLGWD